MNALIRNHRIKILRKPIGIRKKLVFSLCFSVFFVVCIGIGLGYYGAINLVRNRALETQINIANLIARFLNHMLDEEVNLIKAQVTTDVIKEALRDSNKQMVSYQKSELDAFFHHMDEEWVKSSADSAIVRQYTENLAALRLRELTGADKTVQELLITDRYGGLVIATGKTSDYYQADEAWWQEAFASKPGEVIISKYEYDESARRWGMFLSGAIRDIDGEVIGVAKALVDLPAFFAPLEDFKIGRTGYIFLVNEDGDMLFHEDFYDNHKKFISSSQLQDMLTGKVYGFAFDSPIEKKKFFLSAAAVKVSPSVRQHGQWIVLVSQERQEMFSTLNWIILEGSLLFVFLTLLLIPVAVIVGGRFVKPLEELARAADYARRGNLDYVFDIKTGDEIEALSEIFKAMIARIKENQAALLAEKAYLDNIITSMGEALFIFDLDGRIKDVNNAASQLLGYTRSELVSSSLSLFFKPADFFMENVERERLEGSHLIKNIEMAWRAKSGELIPVFFSMSFLYEETEKKKLKAVIGVASDMRRVKKLIADLEKSKHELELFSKGLEQMVQERTEKLEKAQKATINILADMNETQTELRAANKELKKLDQLKSDFVSHVSHELRTPLSVIKESIEIVRDGTIGPVNDEQVDFLETAKRNVDRLVRLINAILDLQKLEAGRIEFNFAYYDLAQLIQDVYKSYSLLVADKGLAFSVKIDPNLPLARFDKDRMIQVFSNLLSNALKFTQKGSIEISARRDGNAVKIGVKDTGDGIKKENIPKLFARFVQLANKIGGSGLGLALCKEIIEAHKGNIWIESQFGQGTTVFFILPLEERRI